MPAVAALSVAGGTAKNRVIVASGKERQRRIGSYYYLRNHPGGASAATKALSTPTSQSAYANICELRWKSLGLEIDLEVGSSSPCTATSLKKDWSSNKSHLACLAYRPWTESRRFLTTP